MYELLINKAHLSNVFSLYKKLRVSLDKVQNKESEEYKNRELMLNSLLSLITSNKAQDERINELESKNIDLEIAVIKNMMAMREKDKEIDILTKTINGI